MTIQDLLDNINALGIGVGSDAEDVLERDLATDVRLPAFINQGVADLIKIRPRRDAVDVDLVALMNESGRVDVNDAYSSFTDRKVERLDAYSFASEDILHYGIVPTFGSEFRVSAKARDYINGLKAENVTIAEVNARIAEENEGLDDEHKQPLLALKTIPVTVTFQAKIASVTVDEMGKEAMKTARVDLEEDLAIILPLFVASKLYLEEDPGKANQYRSEYEARRNEILAREYNHPEASRFVLTNGW